MVGEERPTMDVHEYQAKEILANFGVVSPPGALAYSPEQAAHRSREIGGEAWVVKAQVHAGGRGKAGGVKAVPQRHRDTGDLREPVRSQARHPSDRAGGQGYLPRLYRGRRAHRARDLSRLCAGPGVAAGDDRRLRRGRHGDRGHLGRQTRQHRARHGGTGGRPAGFPVPSDRLQARARPGADGADGAHPQGMLPGVPRT